MATPPASADHVTVVIPARNAAVTIGEQLNALASQDVAAPFDVILVDDGSTDATVNVTRSFAASLPGLRIIDGPGAGPAAARNAGVRASDDGYILCCDADDVVCSAWVRSMSTALAQADLVGGRVDDAELNAGMIRNAHVNYFDDALHVPANYLPYTPSCNVGFRRSVFDALDGFDETLTIAAEDVDFCWRAQESGFTLEFVPEGAVHYRYRRSLGGLGAQAYRYALGFSEVYARRVELGRMSPQSRAWQRRQMMLRLKQLAHVEQLLGADTRWKYVRRAGWSAGGFHGYLRYGVLL